MVHIQTFRMIQGRHSYGFNRPDSHINDLSNDIRKVSFVPKKFHGFVIRHKEQGHYWAGNDQGRGQAKDFDCQYKAFGFCALNKCDELCISFDYENHFTFHFLVPMVSQFLLEVRAFTASSHY